jgi:periplasmic protein TonB
MRKEIVLAASLSVLFHLGFLFGGELTKVNSTEEKKVIEDVTLVEKVKEPPPPPTKAGEEDEREVQDDVILPEDLLASGLAENPVSTVALDVLTMRVKAEAPKPPRPDAMTVGIPSGSQVNNGASAKTNLVFDVKQLDRIPRERYKASPKYPVEMKMNHVEGKVEIYITVDPTGRVIDATIKSSTNSAFEMPALDAARKWRFEPGMKDGTPVTFKMVLPILFNVKKD